MNSKYCIFIAILFSFSLFCVGCRDSNDQANLTNDASTTEPISVNEVNGGEFIDTNDAMRLINSTAVTSEMSVHDLIDISADESSATSTKTLKSSFDRCLIDFNSSSALGLMVDQASSTFATWPYYIQTCSSGDFFVYSEPVNLDHFHLMYEHKHCFGSGVNIGIDSNGNCISQKEAKLWPRQAANMNDDTGIRFYAKNAQNKRNNFDLEGIKVISGSIEVLVYRTDVKKWWIWRNLKPGSWYWTTNNINLSELYIYYNGRNGTFLIDNLEVTNLR